MIVFNYISNCCYFRGSLSLASAVECQMFEEYVKKKLFERSEIEDS